MQQLFPPHASRLDVKLFSIFVANSVPIIGLLTFGTSAAALLVFYWLELGVGMLWTIVRALFAGNPPGEEAEREPFSSPKWATLRFILPDRFFEDTGDDSTSDDGGWRNWQILLPRTGVGVYLGTIPALVVVIFLFTVVWAGFGGVVAGPVVAAANGTETQIWPLTGAGVVFLSQGGQTVTEYFYRGGYQEASVWSVAKGIFYEGLVLVGAGLLVLLSVYASMDGETVSLESAASGPIIFTVIATKVLIELTVYYIDTLDKPLRDLVVPD